MEIETIDAPMTLPLRNPDFTFDDESDPLWNPHAPEFACAANSVSLMMPFVEPYFVRSIRAALPRLDGPLQETALGLASQELAHQHQHRRSTR